MADIPAAPSGPRGNATSGRGRRRGGGGGGGAERGAQGNQAAQDGRTKERGRRGGRNRGRGGGHMESGHGGGGGQPPDNASQGGGTSGDRLARDAVAQAGDRKGAPVEQKGNAKAQAPEEELDEDEEVCFICASKVVHRSVAPCKHWTCHICALRMRALYKTKACAHCRTESPFVIFTDQVDKLYDSFKDSDFVRSDDNLGIRYESSQIFEDTVLLLRYNCPDDNCDVACLGWPDLHRHVKSRHGKVMCDLCTRNKKVFTHEHELYTHAQLKRHEKYGDDIPGSTEQSGFKGHPECGFCRTRFYGDDELYAHCRDKHERCHICDRRSNGRNPQYFVNYDALEDHFKQDHFLCLDKECLEKKFVVFESQMDLKAHQLEEHPNSLSKDARRDARLVDLRGFGNVRESYHPERPRRGAGRGRDPNAEAIPVSTAQPLRRDEIAFHRQMAIQSAQSVTARTFGGQLTGGPSRTPTSQTIRAPSASVPTTRAPSATPPVATTPPASTAPPSLRDQARQIAHAGVIDRATRMLKNDQMKVDDFKAKVSAYRTGKISANHIIDAFFSLFDTSPDELGKLLKELAELYDDDSKRLGLLKAWNDWRAINEDYPALPGAGGNFNPTSTSSGTGGGGARVLMLKNSSAGGRSASARNTFNTVSSAGAFPPLPSSSTRASTSRPASSTRPSWSKTPATASTSASSSRSSSVAPRAAPPAAAPSSSAFPALPAAPKPNTLMAGLTRGTRRWDTPGPQRSAWSNDPTPAETSRVEESEPSTGSSKKGKGKKKQVLYHFG